MIEISELFKTLSSQNSGWLKGASQHTIVSYRTVFVIPTGLLTGGGCLRWTALILCADIPVAETDADDTDAGDDNEDVISVILASSKSTKQNKKNR